MKKALALVSLVTFISLTAVSCGSNSQTETTDSTAVLNDSASAYSDTTQTDSSLVELTHADSTK